jgi:hypothetical protein
VLLIVALAAGVVAVQRPLGRQVHPVPVVTQPPGLVINQAPIPLHPNSGFANYVQGQFNTKLMDITVVALGFAAQAGADLAVASPANGEATRTWRISPSRSGSLIEVVGPGRTARAHVPNAFPEHARGGRHRSQLQGRAAHGASLRRSGDAVSGQT